MKTVGAFEAKTHFSQLLDEAAHGTTITITKHGVPIAKLMSVHEGRRLSPSEAVDALIEFEQKANISLGDLTIRGLIEEGRR
ncbi:MAG: type II toxin-antitoxin system Phd/YefM family antitoxin [Thermomicrobiales bacterium]